MKPRDCSVCATTALAVAISTFAAISFFWALVLVSALSKPDPLLAAIPAGFIDRIFNIWEYWYGFVGALFGAALALAWERRKKRESQERALQNLREILLRNSELMVEILRWLVPGGKPNFSLDTLGLNLWIAASAGIIEDDVLKSLDAFRYQLDHINTKLAVFYSTTGVLEGAITDAEVRQRIRSEQESRLGISEHVVGMTKESARLLSLLQK